jgi:hypothetical protein
MSAKIFEISKNGNTTELPGYLAKLEIDIQDIFEKNLLTLLGIRFVASGKIITKSPKKREVDILGLDDNNYPVIIELKRYKDQGITNQGLSYWVHLNDHRGDFHMLVLEKLGKEAADNIDWSSIRIICIAGQFRDHDKTGVTAMAQNIDLIEYKLYGENLLLIDPVYIGSKNNYINTPIVNGKPSIINTKSLDDRQKRLKRLLNPKWKPKPVFEYLLEFVETLGDDIKIKQTKAYIAGMKITNFVSFQGLSEKLRVSIPMKSNDVDEVKAILPTGAWDIILAECKTSPHKKDFLQLDFNVTSIQEADFTKPFIERGYERS